MMQEKKIYTLSIAGIPLQLETNQCLLQDDAFLPFITKIKKPDIQASFCLVEQLPVIPDSVIYEDNFYRVHQSENGNYMYSFFDAPGDYTPYAVVTRDDSQGIIQVDYLAKGKRCVSEMRNSFAHLNFESILIQRKKMYFHAACIQTHLGGILFSGKSGIGKSTQAELWGKYRDAKQINGDRPILSKEVNGWLAWGSPYAGSSRYHVNESCPITAIIVLKQGELCNLRRMNFLEAFQAVWSGLTIHSWEREFVESASDLTLDLIKNVPVFEFVCTPDEQAVDYLEQGLRKECDL